MYQSESVEVGLFVLSPSESRFVEMGFVKDPIIVFPKNSIWIQHAGSQPFVADTTVVNFYNQGQNYHRFAINPNGDYCHWFRIADDLLAEVVNREQHHFDRENMPCSPAIFYRHLGILNQINQSCTTDQLSIDAEVLAVCADLFSSVASQQNSTKLTTTKHRQLVSCVKETLQHELGVNISLRVLARRHNTSPHHLCRVFKAVTGMGLNHYRTQQRLRALMLEIQNPDTGLVDLAFDHGFSSHAHMSAQFKRYFGLTPSACRQKFSHN